MITRLFFLVVLVLGFSRANGNEVVTATDADFSDVIKKGEIALVKFYAPWCGHCQKLAPEWEKAAKEIPSEAVLIDVDCTKEQELAKKYEIKGYPTIILFRDGEQVEHYKGARNSEEITTYVKSNIGPVVTYPSTAEELTKLKEENEIVCISITSDKNSNLAKTVETAAQKLRSKMKFALVTDTNLSPEQKPETVVVYRKADQDPEEYKGEIVLADLEEFLQTAVIPFAGEISPATYMLYSTVNKEIGWVFLKPDGETSTQIKSQLYELGKKVRKDVVILWVDVDKYAGVMKHLGLPDDAKTPAFVIAKKDKHYVSPSAEPATVDSIERFINDFVAGKLSADIKSQPVPEIETVEGLTTIVGKTMDKYLSSGKDMLIEFFAPWCGHCKKLAPIYAKVAKEFESADVTIAALDATENDVDSSLFDVSGFPTVYFVPSGQKPILFEGERTFYELYKFVRDHASVFKNEATQDESQKKADPATTSETGKETSTNAAEGDL